MKTKILLSMGLMLGATCGFAQSPYTIHNLNFPNQRGSISPVDIDGDGDYDLLFTGEGGNGPDVQLYMNNNDFNMVPTESAFPIAALATVAWGDLNGNGQPDAFMNYFNVDPFSNIFINNGGTFTQSTSFTETPLAPGVAMADVNNDGYVDIIHFGNHNIGNGQPRLYLNDGDGGWTTSTPFAEALIIDAELSVVDYDNDGDLDIFLMAGYEQNSDTRYVRMYRNDGGGNFTTIDIGIIPKGFGSATWGDYDGDGDLDLLINGDGFLNTVEASDDIFRLYNNNGGTFTEATTFEPYRQINIGQGGRFVDWDNDGDLDVIVAGWNPELERQSVAIYLNDGSGNYTESPDNSFIPGVSEGALDVADMNGDGAIDLIVLGWSNHDFDGPESAFISNVAYILENPTSAINNAPSAPTNLQASAGSGTVTFSWDASTDDSTPTASLSYNLYIKDSQGNYIMSPLANVDNGFVTKPQLGNVQLNTSWTISGLAEGFSWGVQAVDNSYLGSEFSSVVVNTNDLFDENVLSVFPNPSSNVFNLKSNAGNLHVRIYSVQGRLIKSFNQNNGLTQFELEPGVYILQAENARGDRGVKKLIAQ